MACESRQGSKAEEASADEKVAEAALPRRQSGVMKPLLAMSFESRDMNGKERNRDWVQLFGPRRVVAVLHEEEGGDQEERDASASR